MGSRSRALADDDVELVVLERGVELFFKDGLQAVNSSRKSTWRSRRLVRMAVRSPWMRGRAGGLLETDVELVGDDGGEGGFAQAGRTEEKDVVQGLAAGSRCLKGDGDLLLRLLLTDELGEASGAELELEGLVVVDAGGGDEAVGLGRGLQLRFARGTHYGRWYGEGRCKSNIYPG